MDVDISVSANGMSYRKLNDRMFVNGLEVFGAEAAAAEKNMHELRKTLDERVQQRKSEIPQFRFNRPRSRTR